MSEKIPRFKRWQWILLACAGGVVAALAVVRSHYGAWQNCTWEGGVYRPWSRTCERTTAWDRDSMQRVLDRHRLLWNRARIRNYECLYKHSGLTYAPGEVFLLTVVEDSIVSVGDSLGETSLENPANLNGFTVEGSFRVIQEAISEGYSDLRVDFDAALHYPTYLEFEYAKNITDARFWVWIWNVRPLDPETLGAVKNRHRKMQTP